MRRTLTLRQAVTIVAGLLIIAAACAGELWLITAGDWTG